MDSFVGGAIIGMVAVGLAALVLAILQKGKACPECGTPAPKLRMPANRRQMLWGGWTCLQCGCELDWRGRRVGASDA